MRLFKITAAVLSAAPKLKVIGRHGAGLDSVDLKAATERRIPVVFTPSAQTMANAVAEHTVQMMLALARHAVTADKLVREGRFEGAQFTAGRRALPENAGGRRARRDRQEGGGDLPKGIRDADRGLRSLPEGPRRARRPSPWLILCESCWSNRML